MVCIQSTDKMMKLLVLSALVAAVYSQIYMQDEPEQKEKAKPYSYKYSVPIMDEEGIGQMTRQESQDENGRVVGSYSISAPDGRQRIVNYIADESGYRASIQTNEPGTKSANPADVAIASSAIDPMKAMIENGQRAQQY